MKHGGILCDGRCHGLLICGDRHDIRTGHPRCDNRTRNSRRNLRADGTGQYGQNVFKLCDPYRL